MISRIKKIIKKVDPLRKAVIFVRSKLKPQPYTVIMKNLEQKDAKNLSQRKELLPLHRRLYELKTTQSATWNSFVYCDGYFYQGYNHIGISGIQPTESVSLNME